MIALGIVYSTLRLSEGIGLAILGLVTIIVTLIVYVVAKDGVDMSPGGYIYPGG